MTSHQRSIATFMIWLSAHAIFLPLSVGHAKTFTVTHTVPAPTTGNDWVDLKLWSEAVTSNGYITSTWYIPEYYENCPIKSAKWLMHTYWALGLGGSSDGYDEWFVLTNALKQAFPSNFFSVAYDTMAKKSVVLAANPFAMGLSPLQPILVSFSDAKVEATYICSDSPPPPPPPPCEKKTWYKDGDNDGRGECGVIKKECTKPSGYAFYCGDNCPDVYNNTGWVEDSQLDKDKDGIGDACDICPDNSDTKAKKWDYFLDKDNDGIPELATKNKPQKFCPPPPAGYASGNNGWDSCDNAKALTWYWDQDKDNHGNPKVTGKGCTSPKKKNETGHWILTPADDECDNDPQSFKKEHWYLDRDGDGFGSNQEYVSYEPFVCRPLKHEECKNMPDPKCQWVVKTGDECDKPGIKGHEKVQKRTDYYQDKDGDGFLNPAVSKKFCTDEEAKIDGYLPKKIPEPEPVKVGGKPAPQDSKLPPQNKPIDVDSKANPGPSKITASWDCDDADDTVGDTITVFKDDDKDGFGDPLQKKVVACSENNFSKDYEPPFEDNENKKGWASNQSDLSEFIPSADLLDNLRQNPGKFFNSGTTASEPQRCLYSGGAVRCMPVGIVKTFCNSGPKLPFIGTADLASAKVTGVYPASLSSVTGCIMKGSGDIGAKKLLSPSGKGLLVTYFEPMGEGIFALQGDDFSLVTPAYVPVEAVSEAVMVALAPYVTTSLAQVAGPVPVAVGANKRRILMDGALGPLTVINSLGANNTKAPDLMLVPWLKLNIQSPKKLPLFTDSDLDGLSDTAELRFGMNPKDADTDGDDYDDMKEYLLGGKTSHLATHWTMVLDTNTINIQLSPDEVAVFNFAKAEAIKLSPATIERLMDMYDGADGVTLDADAEEMQKLISEAQSGIGWSFVAMWVESTTAEYIMTSEFAHFAPRTRPFAKTEGCGPDAQNICVDVLHIAEKNGGELPVYGPIQSTIFYNHPIYGLMEALLHEALHYVVDTSVIEPDSVGQGYLEHKIIFDVLGASDISYMIQ